MTETQPPPNHPTAPPAGLEPPTAPYVPMQRQGDGYPPPAAMAPYPMYPSAPAAPPHAGSRLGGALIIAAAIVLVGIAALAVWVFVVHPSGSPSGAAPAASSSTPYSTSTTPETSTGSTSSGTTDDYSVSADNRFITVLDNNGIPITDMGTRTSAIYAGHSVCQGLDGGLSAAQLVNNIYAGTAFTQYQSGLIVGASVGAYCPRHANQLPK